jgi:hypothetical protein
MIYYLQSLIKETTLLYKRNPHKSLLEMIARVYWKLESEVLSIRVCTKHQYEHQVLLRIYAINYLYIKAN